MSAAETQPDAEATCEGSIWLVRPISEEATAWLRDNTADEATWFGGALCVEPRYVEALINGMIDDGLTVRGG